LTGATGCIGGSILRDLVAHNNEVVCLVRNLAKAQGSLSHLGNLVSFVEVNTTENVEANFRAAAVGHTNIVHSGYFTGHDLDFELSVINGLLTSAKETAETHKVNFVLTTGGLLLGQNPELVGEDEASNANCLDFIKGSVVREEIVIAANSENLHTSVVRPVCIYGGSHVDKYFRAVKQHGKILVPEGNGTISYVHQDDVGTLYRLILENSGTGFFTASEGLGPDLNQVIEIAKAVTGVQEIERLADMNHSWAHMDTYGFYLLELFLTSKLDAKRGRELFGYQPKYNFVRDAATALKLD
jgi:nucleoside-diphosphate-sugar epimerase